MDILLINLKKNILIENKTKRVEMGRLIGVGFRFIRKGSSLCMAQV